MQKLLAHFFFASLAVSSFANQHPCPSLPTLLVREFVIEGAAFKGEQRLSFAQVSLYSRGKFVQHVVTDDEARFTLDHLSPGVYRLSIQGLGSFSVRVITLVEPLGQHAYFSFGKTTGGCLHWGSNTD
jgi:hypothetical protein